MSEPLFSLKDVDYSYPGGIPALNGITLSIRQGERAAIIGANGTGKSTLLMILDALVFAGSGSVHAWGRLLNARTMNDPAWQREFRIRVGYVFQNPDVQLFCPTVREDIVFGPLQFGIPKDEIRTRLDAVAERMQIGPLLDRSPHQLSIGEKKKVAIATVLIIEPQVLLLDEPTSGLDPQTTRDIIAVIDEYHQSGKTVVMATHDLHIVEEIADVVHVLGKNRTLVRTGAPDEILSDQNFLRENNLMHIHVHRHKHTGRSHIHAH
jgi:cobalt/nickel transport system ATP-binding protein